MQRRPSNVARFLRFVTITCAAIVVLSQCADRETPKHSISETRVRTASLAAYITQEKLTQLTSTLASDEFDGRDEGTEGSRKAREYLIAQLEACGVKGANEGSFEQPIEIGRGVNILGRIQGTDPLLADRVVLLSAHYDHLGHCDGAICNGANDNAAGVASVVSIACEIAQNPLPRTVMVAAWDAEEPPTFLKPEMGSAYFVGNPTVPLASIDAAIVLDLVGSELWPGELSHFAMGAEFSPQVQSALNLQPANDELPIWRLGLHLVEELPNGHQPWSDYDAFRRNGVPVLFLSDGQNKRYHKHDDTPELLNFAKLKQEASWLHGVTKRLGEAAITPTFVPGGQDDLNDSRSVVKMLEAAVAPGGMVDALSLGIDARMGLRADLRNARLVLEKAEAGLKLEPDDITTLRRGTQRVMYYASPKG